MPKSNQPAQVLVFNNLQEQYEHSNMPVDLLRSETEFTIFNLKDLNQPMPFKLPFSCLNFFVFVFIKDGYGKCTVNDQTYTLRPQMIYFTNPGHYRAVEYSLIEEVYVATLTEAFLKENVHAAIFEDFPFLLSETFPGRQLNDGSFAEFEDIYLQIHKAHISASKFRKRVVGNLFSVLLFKFKEKWWQDYDSLQEGEQGSNIVKDFRLMLERHYRELNSGMVSRVLQVQDYALALNIHPNYLSNVIKSKTGKPVGTWIAEKNIAEAKALLMNTQLSMKEIAFRLGFLQAAHFSNYFKKHTQYYPSAYRSLHKLPSS